MQNIRGFLNITADASPRRVTANEIKKYITNKNFAVIGALKGGVVEFIELKVSEKSGACGQTVRNLNLPRACIIAAIVNESGAKVPGANDTIKAGDDLVLILEKEKIREVADMFVR